MRGLMPLPLGDDFGSTLVTGASGFVGAALLSRLRKDGLPVMGVSRTKPTLPDCVQGPSLEADGDWAHLLQGIETVVHTAARVHLMRDSAADPLRAFREVNVNGSLNLARHASLGGVRRFVFISSIKVNGEHTTAGHPFTAHDTPSPQDAYGVSKAEAESGLKALAAETGMALVIIRPPLVYGLGVKGNFAAMMRAVRRGIPLPLGAATDNRRSLVGLDNLVDLIVTCISHPAAAGETFLVSDNEDLSTTDLLRRLGTALQKPARLLPIPLVLLETGAAMLGKKDEAKRLLGTLQVDIGHTCETLNWRPPVSVDEGLRRAARGMME